MRSQLYFKATIVFIMACLVIGYGQNSDAPPPLNSLAVPEPNNLFDFVKPGKKQEAIELGKALFWDMQAGSDGIQACASCHFHVGADVRPVNQLSPGPDNIFDVGLPNETLTQAHYPFHRLEDPEDAESNVISSSDDRTSSQGVFNSIFNDIILFSAEDDVTFVADPIFNVAGIDVRRVEPRNTPSVINAVFNVENFWDGRAKFIFNGINPSGTLDTDAKILEKQLDGSVVLKAIKIDRASLASQAVGPPLSDFEMSGAGRTFPKLGKKLLVLRPLNKQMVRSDDSVLGPYTRDDGVDPVVASDQGLTFADYRTMVETVFQEKYWDSPKVFDGNQNEITAGTLDPKDEFSLMEMNFSLFWGLALQMYQSTLVADQTRFDQFQTDGTGLTKQEEEGLEIFLNQGACINCHSGPEFTGATVDQRIDNPFEENGDLEGVIERMNMADGEAIYDGGFYNIGVRPTADDIGRGATGPGGLPISFSRFADLVADSAEFHDRMGMSPGINIPGDVLARKAVDGAMKTPGLRNIELSGPYFHNGGAATLRDVVLFYTRGGNFAEENIANLDPDIDPIGHIRGKPERQRALVAFMLTLTDDRAAFHQAPFDHPSLLLPLGHPGNENSVTVDPGTGNAAENFVELPAIGAGGATDIIPNLMNIPTFLDLDPFESSQPLPDGDNDQDVNDEVVLFALNSIRLGDSVSVKSGDVMVEAPISTPALNPAAELTIGTNVSLPVDFTAAAHRIEIQSGATIASEVRSNALNADPGATITGSQSSSLAMPLFAIEDVPEFKWGPVGTTDITVPASGSQTLAPGTYNNITVGDGAELILDGGVYNIRSLSAGNTSKVLFEKFSEVLVAERFSTGSGSTVGPTLTSSEDACGMVIYVAGSNGGSGVLSTPLAADIGTTNIFSANILCADGTLRVGANSTTDGVLMAIDVEVENNVEVSLDSRVEFGAFLNRRSTGPGDIDDNSNLPKTLTLDQNYPNPFNPSTTIRFGLPKDGHVELAVYNIIGQLVTTLVSESMDAGYHEIQWNGRDQFGSVVASGVYIYRLTNGLSFKTGKMIMMK